MNDQALIPSSITAQVVTIDGLAVISIVTQIGKDPEHSTRILLDANAARGFQSELGEARATAALLNEGRTTTDAASVISAPSPEALAIASRVESKPMQHVQSPAVTKQLSDATRVARPASRAVPLEELEQQ